MTASAPDKLKRRFLTDKSGNFGIMTAILLPVLLGFAGAGMELANVMQVKADMQNTADSAALAAATEARLKKGDLTDEQIKEIAKGFIAAQMEKKPDRRRKEETGGEFSNQHYDDGKCPRQDLHDRNHDQPQGSAQSAARVHWRKNTRSFGNRHRKEHRQQGCSNLHVSGARSFRLDVVQDGYNRYQKTSCQNYTADNWGKYPNLGKTSPCYVNKATSLKTAVGFLVATLNKADPTYTANGSSQLVRTGASVYTHETYAVQPLSWGTSSVVSYVDKQIPEFPTGGTDARSSLNAAYNALKKANPDEAKAHKTQGNESFERYIVLMTDGEMTGNSASWNSSIDQSVRTTCETAKKDGIKIFSVAFMAPDKGKALLQYCASSADNYYAPENMEQIVTAFGEIARKAAGSIATLTN